MVQILQADTVNGVYFADDFEGEVMSQGDFYDELADLEIGKIINCYAHDDMITKIRAEYGIN